ncbi:AbrB/MazE/SpoVT family DNA-binding domain-containing protein [Xanthobacteraceae bacterium A53D]
MITSKLNREAQTTIPQPVRAALHLREGDEIAYVIEGDAVTIRKVSAKPAAPQDDPIGTFGEWAGDADRKAYGNL